MILSYKQLCEQYRNKEITFTGFITKEREFIDVLCAPFDYVLNTLNQLQCQEPDLKKKRDYEKECQVLQDIIDNYIPKQLIVANYTVYCTSLVEGSKKENKSESLLIENRIQIATQFYEENGDIIEFPRLKKSTMDIITQAANIWKQEELEKIQSVYNTILNFLE